MKSGETPVSVPGIHSVNIYEQKAPWQWVKAQNLALGCLGLKSGSYIY